MSESIKATIKELLTAQRDWSLKTFGEGQRTEGIVKHIYQELQEIVSNPRDLEEWADVAILAMDGAWRSIPNFNHVLNDMYVTFKVGESVSWGKAIESIEANLRMVNGESSYLEFSEVFSWAGSGAGGLGCDQEKFLEIIRAKQQKNFAREWPKNVPENEPANHIEEDKGL